VARAGSRTFLSPESVPLHLDWFLRALSQLLRRKDVSASAKASWAG
jgi:hypothetical protein